MQREVCRWQKWALPFLTAGTVTITLSGGTTGCTYELKYSVTPVTSPVALSALGVTAENLTIDGVTSTVSCVAKKTGYADSGPAIIELTFKHPVYGMIGDDAYPTKDALVEAIIAATGNITINLGANVTSTDFSENFTSGSIGYAIKNSGATSVSLDLSATSLMALDGYAFQNCIKLESVAIPNGVTSIEVSTFYQCSSLTSVIIPSSVTNIGEMAFYACNKLESVTISSSVTTIGKAAFRSCNSLTSATFENPNGWTVNNMPLSFTNQGDAADKLKNTTYNVYIWTRSE